MRKRTRGRLGTRRQIRPTFDNQTQIGPCQAPHLAQQIRGKIDGAQIDIRSNDNLRGPCLQRIKSQLGPLVRLRTKRQHRQPKLQRSLLKVYQILRRFQIDNSQIGPQQGLFVGDLVRHTRRPHDKKIGL